MAYADRNSVLARAGRLKGAWTDATSPDLPDLDRFLDEVAGEIDLALSGHGIVLPLDTVASAGMAGMNADGALVLLLEATFPADSGPASAKEILDGARARWLAGMASLITGKNPVVIYSTTKEQLGASNFWDREPAYPTYTDRWQESWYPGSQIAVHRGQRF